VPLNEDFEVIVVGGGPAGCTAAAAAAREGAKTLLVEATGALGGMGTSGLVPGWCPFSDKQQMIYRGLAEQVLNACKAAMPQFPADRIDAVPIDSEHLKRVYDDLVGGAGVETLFLSMLCAVERTPGSSVDTLILANKAGLSAWRAPVYVDCTGDADLAAWAGATVCRGDAAGEMQPATHCFVLSNVDEQRYRDGPSLHGSNPASPIYDIVKSGDYPLIKDNHLCSNPIGAGTVGFNAGHLWDVDGTDPRSLSQALVQGRKIAAQFRDALSTHCPDAFGDAFLAGTGSLMGVRETRRIVGDYVLELADYLARRTFADEICRCAYFVDVHTAKAEIGESRGGQQHFEKRTHRYGPGESYGIPYRCLCPQGLRNVLVAGRSISTDRAVQGSTRVMPVCLAMGEAAGMAAAHAVRYHDGDIHAVDVQRLRTRLMAEGAYLPAGRETQTENAPW
jgi:hypothetical protein